MHVNSQSGFQTFSCHNLGRSACYSQNFNTICITHCHLYSSVSLFPCQGPPYCSDKQVNRYPLLHTHFRLITILRHDLDLCRAT